MVLSQLQEFEPSVDEPSVWTPPSPDLLELYFVGGESGTSVSGTSAPGSARTISTRLGPARRSAFARALPGRR